MDDLDRRFGAHIRNLRQARRLTQETLAERSELSVDSVRRIEKGGFSPSLDTIGKLAVGLEVSLPTLFQGLDPSRHDLVPVLCDYLARRSGNEVKLATRVLHALFEDDALERPTGRRPRARS